MLLYFTSTLEAKRASTENGGARQCCPKVPTARESGFPNLDATVWSGFFVPSKTPKAVTARLTQGRGHARDPAEGPS